MEKKRRTSACQRTPKGDANGIHEEAGHPEQSTTEMGIVTRRLARTGLSTIERSYLRGRLLSFQVRQAGRGTPRSKVVRDLAAELGVEESVLRADSRFARAVDALIDQHGELARQVILGKDARLPARKVGEISRMAVPRQRAELESYATSGKPFDRGTRYADLVDRLFPVAPNCVDVSMSRTASELPPLDTVKFSEVISRLVRAGGMLAKNIVEVPRLKDVRPSLAEKQTLSASLRQIARHATLLLHLVENLESRSPKPEGSTS